MRFAAKRCSSGWTVRSALATMYQLGFDFHAVPSTFWEKRSAAGAACVAQTTFCSCSERSPVRGRDPARLQPDAPIRDLDMREHVRHRKFVLLVLRCFVRVRRECGDIDEPDHAGIDAGGGDQSTP